MSLLLDTHVWLWTLLDPSRLTSPARALLASPDATLHLSPISLWETLLLAERGRLRLQPDGPSWLRHALSESPVVETPLTADVALASRSLSIAHEDLADRFIAATAAAFDLKLVTSDRRLIACPDIEVIPA